MHTLRDYQHDAVDAAWQFLCSQAGSPVIVLPTGAGKSLVIAKLCEDAVKRWAGKVIVLAHRKELLSQNAEKIAALLPDMKIGVYSAGLGMRERNTDIVVAGIQSVFRKAFDFGQRHLVLIDEVHLTPPEGDGMYRTFLSDLRTANPQLRMVGLTATPFRLDCGPLCGPQRLFQKVAYSANIREMIAAGWLCNLTTRPADAMVDTSGIHLRGGEFVEHEVITAFDKADIVTASCREIVAKTAGRKSVLIFCAGVSHAAHVQRTIEGLTGEACGTVTGDTLPLERSATLQAFRNRSLRFLTNIDCLTTGFDAPCIDTIAILRATMSPGLFVQICGRGFRVHPEKADCLVLDFGENIKRHGPIDAIDYGRARGSSVAGEVPTKTCPNCQSEVHLAARECECGFQFPPPKINHEDKADAESEILSTPQRWMVEEILYYSHKKNGGDTLTLQVDYACKPIDSAGNLESKRISEWVCFSHAGFARMKAVKWWRARSITPVPETVEDAIELCKLGAVAPAKNITTRKDGRWDRVIAYELDEKPTEWNTGEEVAVGWEEEEIPF